MRKAPAVLGDDRLPYRPGASGLGQRDDGAAKSAAGEPGAIDTIVPAR
jgi:hypothetical protein